MRMSVAKKHSGIGNKEISAETDCDIGSILNAFDLWRLLLSGSSFITTVVKTNKVQREKTLQKPDLFHNFQSEPEVLFIFAILSFYSLLHTHCLWLTTQAHYYEHTPSFCCHSGDIDRVFYFLPLLRSHHHFVHTPHGWGRHLRRPHRHHLPRQAAVLWLLALPEEILWQRLLPHSGARWGGEDDDSADWYHTQAGQRGTNSNLQNTSQIFSSGVCSSQSRATRRILDLYWLRVDANVALCLLDTICKYAVLY